MIPVNLSALLLLATECLTMYFMVQAVWFPLLAFGLGVICVTLPERYHLDPFWAKLFSFLILGIGVARLLMMNRESVQENIPEYANLFNSYDNAYWIAQIGIGYQWILLSMGITDCRYPVRKTMLSRTGSASLFFCIAVTGQICIMNRIIENSQQGIMLCLSILFMIISALFILSCSTIPNPPKPYRKSIGYWTISTLLLITSAISSGVATHFIQNNQKELDALFLSSFPNQNAETIGFSRKSSLGSLQFAKRLTPDGVALRVIADDAPGYLRGIVYDQYERNAWYTTQDKTTLLPSKREITQSPETKNYALFELSPTTEQPHIVQEIWPDGATRNTLFTPLNTAWISLPVQSIQIDPAGITEILVPPIPKSYRYYLNPNRHMTHLPDDLRTKWLEVPSIVDPKVYDLARTLTEGCITNTQKAAAITRYFTSQYQYSLRISIPSGVEPLNYFILNKPAAHCEFFASAATILLRIAKVPCRYVNGFLVTQRSSFADYWIAYNHDAHAWVEAYDENNGWFVVEATPADGLPNANETLNFKDFWNALHFKGPGITQWAHNLKMLILFPIVAWKTIVTLLLILFLWRFIRKWPQRKNKMATPDKKYLHAMNSMLKIMDQRAASKGLIRSPHETLHHFSTRIRMHNKELRDNVLYLPGEDAWFQAAADWYLQYATVRYGPTDMETEREILKNTMPEQTG